MQSSQVTERLGHVRSREGEIGTGRSSFGQEQSAACGLRVALLTGSGDKPYALGLVEALVGEGAFLDFVGSDQLDCPQLRNRPQVNFLNLRGDQRDRKSVV